MRPISCILLILAVAASRAVAEEIPIHARNLAARSKNIAPEYTAFDNLTLCVGRDGYMEWAADVRGGEYWIHFRYCSGERRPCRLSVNGREIAEGALAEPTGGFFTAHLRWRTAGPVKLDPGRQRIRLTADGLMPHLKGLVVSTNAKPPQGAFRDPQAEARRLRESVNLDGLKRAIEYLASEHGERYPRAEEFLTRLGALEPRVGLQGVEPSVVKDVGALRREALVDANPLMRFDRLLFVRRYTYQSNHYYTDYINGCVHFGGNLCVLSLEDGSVTELVPSLAGGIFGRFDLSFDGQRVVFDYKKAIGEGFRIWEVGIDGKGLRQITFPPTDEAERIRKYKINDLYQHHTDDMHPCYLPDGGICFVSSRCERGILCDPPDLFTTTTLYRMNRDGGAMEVLSQSPVSEASPSVMNDGRILYTRWEYVDKPDVVIKCLWSMRPDGTGSAEVYGNLITFPDTLLHGRAIPGHDNLFVVIGAPHMPLGVGTVIRVDLDESIRTRSPMTYVTPDVDIREEYGYRHLRDGRWVRDGNGPLFVDAYPLDPSFYLVSCNPDKPWNDVSAYGLWLIDVFGNRVLIHDDDEMSCWQPVPLRSRVRPPAVASSRSTLAAVREKDAGRTGRDATTSAPAAARRVTEGTAGEATVVLTDVYRGLEGVERGTIRYLRVLETLPRPWAARRFWPGDGGYQQHAIVSMNGSLHVKRLIGIVPVESDGSAGFIVPADRNLFFQALDEDFMEVQRMRTFVNLRPGESRSCTGCHSEQGWAPDNQPVAALRIPPRRLAAQPGDAKAERPIHYPTDVQPILDRHCVRCHGAERLDGELDLSGAPTTLFNRSYESLVRKKLVQVFHENQPKTGPAAPIPPYSLGSHVSALVSFLRGDHYDAKLDRSELIRVVTWIDANSPYYGTYFGRRNLRYRDLPDFRPVPQ